MAVDVRPFDTDARAFFEAGELAFAERPRDEDFEAFEALFEPDRAIAAYDGDRIVGTAGAFGYALTVPGGVLPASGVTIVGVHPTHRRQGILRRMMRLQLDGIHERGEPLAILWASESSIYQRFGYGMATLAAKIDVARERNAFRRPHVPAGTIRFVDDDEAARLFPPIYDAVRPTRPGFFDRSDTYWREGFLRDPEHGRQGMSAAFHVVHETGGVPDGYARYRVKEQWEDVGFTSAVIVVEKMATNPSADLDLWRFVLDIDLMARTEYWNIAADDPILLAALEPRRLRYAASDGIWLRIVEVGSALAGRRYAADGRLVIELADEFCPWNDGRWALSVEDGVPIVERTSDAADLAADTTDLAAAYLGAFTFRALADAARVRELHPGAIARADALFRTERAPWCPRVF
ncbi:MAG TPA: GNAT family N-acetyltransferase [Candidatus Limnocylindria bacterium]|nr:GNAT family N-acetyltransferase [Candidatus Limnocylindria bacterium]